MSPELLQQVAFLVFSFVVLGAALGVVLSRTVFVAALWLVLSFIGVAGLYVLLGAGFLAVIQILVYVGAISVLILFAIMLTEDVMGGEKPNSQWALVAMVALTLWGFLTKASFTTDWQVKEAMLAPNEGVEIAAAAAKTVPTVMQGADGVAILPNQVAQLGQVLMTEHLLAFEVISVILLMALVGAIVIARD
jgi:NADH-quinone oxidoreductase subunit J